MSTFTPDWDNYLPLGFQGAFLHARAVAEYLIAPDQPDTPNYHDLREYLLNYRAIAINQMVTFRLYNMFISNVAVMHAAEALGIHRDGSKLRDFFQDILDVILELTTERN